MKYVSVAVPRPVDHCFTYSVPEEWIEKVRVGGWVRVPFGRATTHAYVIDGPIGVESLPSGLEASKIKAVLESGDQASVLPAEILRLCQWAGEYYASPLGEVLNCAAPAAALGLRSAKRQARTFKKEDLIASCGVTLTDEQVEALHTLQNLLRAEPSFKDSPAGPVFQPRVALLHGVTGSGKTEVYLELAKEVLASGKSVLIIVPEIALTTQLERRFSERLGEPVGLWHSALADGKRRDLCAQILEGQLRVVVGARSAVFAPLQSLGLIVVDEEHDSSYKQEDRVRYQARDLAIVRSTFNGAMVVLGSATPSLETRERVRESRYQYTRLSKRPGESRVPDISIVSLSEAEMVENTQTPMAKETLKAIQETLDAGQQVIVFLNRRGYANFLICEDCGDVKGCPDCSISLTMHRYPSELRCHVCGHREEVPLFCVKCQGTKLRAIGGGTESLEEELPKFLNGAKILRLDRDQITSTKRLNSVLDEFRSGRANLLLGTQMLVKGHDFPGVTLVVVMLADALFRFPDFRASERAWQILTQVSGRAGRASLPGRVLIQAYQTNHCVLDAVTGRLSEEDFLNQERDLRSALGYPPFGRLARIRIENKEKQRSVSLAHAIAHQIEAWKKTSGRSSLEVLGPSEAFLERAKGLYRWDITLRSKDFRDLQTAVRVAKGYAISQKAPLLVDIDPNGLG